MVDCGNQGLYLREPRQFEVLLALNPVVADRASARFNISRTIDELVGEEIRDGDVLVISSKYIAISEGRVVPLNGVTPSVEARSMGRLYRMSPRLCELILRESDFVVGGIPGFVLASRDGLLTPNAGIDKSNIEHGKVVLYPRRPEESADRIREAIRFSRGVEVAVVVCDSRLMPTRRGTTGVALASSGLESIVDLRGRKDLFGKKLKVTSQAIADDLSSAAELILGESNESVPIVLVRGLNQRMLGHRTYSPMDFGVDAQGCVYLRSLGFSPRNSILRGWDSPQRR